MIRKFVFILIAVFCSMGSSAQNGTITGQVIDKITGEPIPYVNVQLIKNTYSGPGAVADFNGNYKILHIPPGIYSIEALTVGYQPIRITNVEIKRGKTVVQNFELIYKPEPIHEVQVIAYEIPQINKENTVVTYPITAEDVEKMPGRSVMRVAGSVASLTLYPISIIPQPKSLEQYGGFFELTDSMPVFYNKEELKSLAQYLIDGIRSHTGIVTHRRDGIRPPAGIELKLAGNPGKGSKTPSIGLVLEDGGQPGDQSYMISATPAGFMIVAKTTQGLFYGVQTMFQMFPDGDHRRITTLEIKDEPRFGWRGLLLDVSRHFFTIDEVKRMIDEMVMYKFNLLHLHLSDDQGWRVEIKSLPELTQTGAWRVPRTGLWWDREPPKDGEKATYGGFYTQDQIRDLVAYAKERHVDILPEIDVPGHSLAAIASYPWLSSTKLPYRVNPGSKFYTIEDNSLCPGHETTFEFLDKVFTEMAQLFPFEYIHIGGDECYKGFWEKCPDCQKRMKDNNLKNLDELQSYFIKRVEKILEAKGKKLMGWDEILEGGLAPNAAVMSWRGMEGGITAAKAGHKVVMSPNDYAYIDLYQGDPALEPPTYGMLRLKKVYEFEPVPAGIDPSLILGGQGNLWSESVPTFRHAEYMLWPRSFALAEVLWSTRESRNWNSFLDRTEVHLARLGQADINYAVSYRDAIIKTSKDEAGNLLISLSTEVEGLQLFYTFDNTYPDNYSTLYKPGEKLSIPKDADTFRVVTYRYGKPYGRIITVPVAGLFR
jgi:hexosaminidase